MHKFIRRLSGFRYLSPFICRIYAFNHTADFRSVLFPVGFHVFPPVLAAFPLLFFLCHFFLGNLLHRKLHPADIVQENLNLLHTVAVRFFYLVYQHFVHKFIDDGRRKFLNVSVLMDKGEKFLRPVRIIFKLHKFFPDFLHGNFKLLLLFS